MKCKLFYRLMIVFLLLIFCGVVQTYAQTKDRVYFGLKFGGYTGFYKGDNFFSKDLGYKIGSKTLAHFGVLLEIPLAKNLALQPEILWYEGGYQWITETQFDETGGNKYNVIERMEFVSVPILLKYKAKGFGVYAGVQPDYMISANREINGRPTSISGDFEKQDYRKGLYISGIGGIEYTFPFGLGMSARYQLGLTNIAKPTELGLYEKGNSIKTDALFYGIHWRFGRPRKI